MALSFAFGDRPAVKQVSLQSKNFLSIGALLRSLRLGGRGCCPLANRAQPYLARNGCPLDGRTPTGNALHHDCTGIREKSKG